MDRCLIIFITFDRFPFQVGEQIIAINGQSTEQMTHKDVVTLLKSVDGAVDMEVGPPDEATLSNDQQDSSDDGTDRSVTLLYYPWYFLF